MQLIDTHAHPHMMDEEMSGADYFKAAEAAGVETVVCIGTDADDSRRAVAAAHEYQMWATVGLHPHEADKHPDHYPQLSTLADDSKVVAIGECGLDYHYEHSPREDQAEALHAQINLAKQQQLPLVFHVRDAYEAFWEVFDMHQNISGVVHSFTGNEEDMRQAVARGLYVGINGIVTFARDKNLQAAVRELPLEHTVLETDAPYLTPKPFRGTMNHSAHVKLVAEYIAEIKGEQVETVARYTTENARRLFGV